MVFHPEAVINVYLRLHENELTLETHVSPPPANNLTKAI
jgi:hypothetical protein